MFKDNLKELRLKENLTQKELADKIFVSRSAVAKWEQGRGLPTLESLELLCNIFNINEDELLDKKEPLDLYNKAKKKKKIVHCFNLILIILLGFVFTCIGINKIEKEVTYQSKVVKKFLGEDYSSIKYIENGKYVINGRKYNTVYHFTCKIKSLNDLELCYVKSKYIVEDGYDSYIYINKEYGDSLARIMAGDYKMTRNEITSKDGKTLYKYIGKSKEYILDDDIEQINDLAFLDTNFKKLELNKKLTYISPKAFTNSEINNLTISNIIPFKNKIDFPYESIKTLVLRDEPTFWYNRKFPNLENLILDSYLRSTNALFLGLKIIN